MTAFEEERFTSKKALADRLGISPHRIQSVVEAHRTLGVSTTTIYNRIKSGRIESYQTGRCTVVVVPDDGEGERPGRDDTESIPESVEELHAELAGAEAEIENLESERDEWKNRVLRDGDDDIEEAKRRAEAVCAEWRAAYLSSTERVSQLEQELTAEQYEVERYKTLYRMSKACAPERKRDVVLGGVKSLLSSAAGAVLGGDR